MARFGALTELDLDHLHLRLAGLLGEALRVEVAIIGPAAEITTADLPHQIAAMFQMVRADAAFTGVMVETAQLRALVQRADRVGTERTKAHRRDVEYRGRVGLRAVGTANTDPKGAAVAVLRRQHGVADEFVAIVVDIDQGAESLFGVLVLGPGIHQRTLGTGKGQGFAVAFEQVLADLRADAFHQIANVADHRVVAADGLGFLPQVIDADQTQRTSQQGDHPHPRVAEGHWQAEQGKQHTEGEHRIAVQQRQTHANSGGMQGAVRVAAWPSASQLCGLSAGNQMGFM